MVFHTWGGLGCVCLLNAHKKSYRRMTREVGRNDSLGRMIYSNPGWEELTGDTLAIGNMASEIQSSAPNPEGPGKPRLE